MQSVAGQIVSFLMIMLLGVLIGILFDCYRSIRHFWRPGRGAAIAGDLLFSLLVTAIACVFLLLVNWGEVRAYVFMAIALGLFLYLKSLSRHMRGLLAFLFLKRLR